MERAKTGVREKSLKRRNLLGKGPFSIKVGTEKGEEEEKGGAKTRTLESPVRSKETSRWHPGRGQVERL